MSLSAPSHVSATIGSDQSNAKPFRTSHSITASRTTPTLWVLVIMIGPARKPDSSSHVVPVISPLPFSVNHAPKTGSPLVAPRGKTAVAPVRTGPCPTTSLPWPRMIVLCPTVTPATSVIALSAPGVPSNGTPRSRARGRVCACRWDARTSRRASTRMSVHLGMRKQRLPHFEGGLPPRFARLGQRLHYRVTYNARHITPELSEIGRGRVLLHVE